MMKTPERINTAFIPGFLETSTDVETCRNHVEALTRFEVLSHGPKEAHVITLEAALGHTGASAGAHLRGHWFRCHPTPWQADAEAGGDSPGLVMLDTD